jgi:hypothetical protein
MTWGQISCRNAIESLQRQIGGQAEDLIAPHVNANPAYRVLLETWSALPVVFSGASTTAVLNRSARFFMRPYG